MDADEQNRWMNQYHELAQLAGSLAHEIKNPLSVIRMNMDLLAEDLADAETQRERRTRAKVDMVHGQCTRLENLLNDFLKFACFRRSGPGGRQSESASRERVAAVRRPGERAEHPRPAALGQ